MPTPIFSLDDLTTPSTKEEVQQAIYDVLSVLGVRTTSWKPGAVVRTMITGVAVVASAYTQLSAGVARGGFLELAESSWLTLKAYYDYKTDRVLATFATGVVTLTNTSGAIYPVVAEDLILRNAVTKKLYRNTADFTLGAGATLPIPVRAIEAGSASSAAPGDISELETTLNGVTCSNAAALAGADDESDPALRARASAKLGSLSPFGPWDAYTYAVTSAKRTDGTPVGIRRVRVISTGNGWITVAIASATGPVTGTLGDQSSDLGAVNYAVQRQAAPQGITAVVQSAVPHPIAITYQAYIYNTTNLTEAQIKDLISAKLVAFMAAQPVGGIVLPPSAGAVFMDAIRAAIRSARPEIFHVVLTLPALDEVLAPTDVPVLGTVTGAITQVPPPEGV